MLILYPATLLNLFFVEFFRIFYLYRVMSAVKRDAFTSSFPTWMPSFLALAGTCSTVSNSGSESSTLVLFLL